MKKQLDAKPKASKPDFRAKKETVEKAAIEGRYGAFCRDGHELGKQGELEAKASYAKQRKASRKEQRRLKRLEYQRARELKNG